MKSTTLKKILLIGSLIISIGGAGCSQKVFFENEEVIRKESSGREFPMELYVEEDVKPGQYEPETGIYTGAYVQKDNNIKGDLLAYERLTGQKQTFKVFTYNPQEGISKQDILRCIAQKKVPYVKLLLGSSYDLTPLYQFIFDIRDNYHTPIFIELYPLTEKDYSINEYKETYQRAYEILHKYLTDIVIVWSTDETRVMDMAVYYPGNSYVDWAGINVYIPRYKGQDRYVYDGLNSLDYWYKSFQDKKPMLISALAVSHFSKIDHTYSIQETEDHLTLFYQKILGEYPRLKGIIYMDVDMSQISSKGKEDYCLTGQPALLETMKNLSTPLNINVTLQNEVTDAACYMKYSVMGTYFQDELYIAQEYMYSCFKNLPLKKIEHVEDLTGELYYSYADIQKYCKTYYKA